ncbi:Guanylate cyclase domain-containing protein [Plasmodiophora brassicae]
MEGGGGDLLPMPNKLGELTVRSLSRRSIHQRPASKKNFNVADHATLTMVPSTPQMKHDITVIEEENPRAKKHVQLPGWPQSAPKIDRPPSTMQVALRQFADRPGFVILMTIVTLFSLFGDDARIAWAPTSADTTFGILSTVATCLFLFEFVVQCVTMPRVYILSFEFFLDLLSTVAMATDIPGVWNNLAPGATVSLSSLTVARAGRAAKIGTRAARIGRMFRIVRLGRFGKVVKRIVTGREGDSDVAAESNTTADKKETEGGPSLAVAGTTTTASPDPVSSTQSSLEQGSIVGRKLADLTTRRVVVVVLLILFVVPMLIDTPVDETVLVALERIESASGDVKSALIRSLLASPYVNLLYVRVDDTVLLDLPSDGFRTVEMETISTSRSVAVSDIKAKTVTTAEYSCALTAFTVLILGVGALLFSRDALVLAIEPVERMVTFVRKLASDPLGVINVDNSSDDDGSKPRQLETDLLENTLIKLGSLLQIGFGSAGANIIAKNFAGNQNALNPMLPGCRVNALFAFCDIRRFTDTTECLQENVMVFVNEIANVVHGCCHRLGGAANKNIGDAFLIVWKLDDDVESIARPQSVGAFQHHHIADQAVIAFVHCIVELLTSPQLQSWRVNTRITDRMPNYNVNLGVGIHWGWAIEGAIGSELKIDASYLSPHVDMSQVLEELTKVYGVPLIFSGEVYDTLSGPMQQLSRCLDVVQLRSGSNPMRVYTFDIGKEALEIQKSAPAMPLLSLNRGSIMLTESRRKRESVILVPTRRDSGLPHQTPLPTVRGSTVLSVLAEDDGDDDDDNDDDDDGSTEEEVSTHEIGSARPSFIPQPNCEPNYVKMDFATQVKPYRVGVDPQWIDMFNRSVKLYVDGKWEGARDGLSICQSMVTNDAPTRVLLDFMQTFSYQPPPDWAGFRRLGDIH